MERDGATTPPPHTSIDSLANLKELRAREGPDARNDISWRVPYSPPPAGGTAGVVAASPGSLEQIGESDVRDADAEEHEEPVATAVQGAANDLAADEDDMTEGDVTEVEDERGRVLGPPRISFTQMEPPEESLEWLSLDNQGSVG